MYLFFLIAIQSGPIDHAHELDEDIIQNEVIANTTTKDLVKNNASEILTNKEHEIKTEKQNNITIDKPSENTSVPVKKIENITISKNETKQISKNVTEIHKKPSEANVTLGEPPIALPITKKPKNVTKSEDKPHKEKAPSLPNNPLQEKHENITVLNKTIVNLNETTQSQVNGKPKPDVKLNTNKTINQTNVPRQNSTKLQQNQDKKPVKQQNHNATVPKNNKTEPIQPNSTEINKIKINSTEPSKNITHNNTTKDNKLNITQNSEIKLSVTEPYEKVSQVNETKPNITTTNNSRPIIAEIPPNQTIPKYIKYSKTQSDDEKPQKLNNPDPIERMKHFNETDEQKEFKMIIPMKDVQTEETNNTMPSTYDTKPNATQKVEEKLNNSVLIEKIEQINETKNETELNSINVTNDKPEKPLLKKKESEIEINVTFNDVNETELNQTDIINENTTLEEPSQSEVLPGDDKTIEIEELDKKLDENIKNRLILKKTLNLILI
ncbi:hypothetical protein TVAG_189780 [Trichomonas vaginalis G3]|uniref:Uncharacterized protein n=1 Tax=Trichomonas vaginalis (strain ATCC PRA-98 / G3) TaxID=412133 RepID=A2DKB0_TRIV3|nr:hypothetical protein TVAG_189780 [Trichomonas vaginalis G3]|eukprot:XP_001580073.1 hypothetical protein [Trichomonas vaginalis G3]